MLLCAVSRRFCEDGDIPGVRGASESQLHQALFPGGDADPGSEPVRPGHQEAAAPPAGTLLRFLTC